MSEIGKSLVFFFQYYEEMTRLYSEGGTIPGIDAKPDRKSILEKVDEVGRAAGVEAYSLLIACTSDWLTKLEAKNVARISSPRRKAIEANFGMTLDVRSPNEKQSLSPLKRQMGLHFGDDGLLPWVWSRGGVQVERKIFGLLPANVERFASKAYGWNGGAVVFSPIKIPWETATHFTLDASAVIDEAKQALEILSPQFLDAFLNGW
ncbi:MAG TPA: hypothetical protein VGM64_07370 [Lacunisphaera sp.]|jgi:hypothetical protein